MKKQFFRVKQFADQTFSRAGKTELLSDELAEVDKHVEFLKNACTNTNKKLAACLQGYGTDDTAREKRLKKCPEYLLGHAMLESANCEGQSLLREVLARCGGVSLALSQELVDYEVQVEQSVVNPLQGVLDNDIPTVMKHKRNLTKLVLDMDSAKARYQAALKHGNTGTQSQAKIDAIKEEMEDAESKVEQCRDALASEMFQLVSKEAEFAKIVANYVKIQKSYHSKALQYLECIAPELDTFINDSDMKPVFGFPLEEHLRVTGRKIALPIELCICALLEMAMGEEGLFRVAGGASKVRRMRLCLDAGYLSLSSVLEMNDPHVVSGVFKSYLRELPEPLLTQALYADWVAAAKLQGPEEVRSAMKDVVERLPEANFDNLRYIVKFLATLARNQDVNKMSPQNLAIVIAPNVIWGPDHHESAGMNMSTANIHSFIVDNLVTYANYFFPQEVEFYQTFQKGEENKSVNGMMGHTRSSSGDALLISYPPGEAEMKRTQSNSSLTDHSSPPHSPKPVTRRKNKVAPHPPRVSEVPRMSEVPRVNEVPDKPRRPVSVHSTPSAKIIMKPAEPSTPPPKPAEPTSPPPSQPLRERSEFMENLTAIDAVKPTEFVSEKKEIVNEKETVVIRKIPAFDRKETALEKNEIISEMKEPIYSEIMHKTKPVEAEIPRKYPVAAPRTLVTKDATQNVSETSVDVPERPKPAIPERPATLRSSFRQNRLDDLMTKSIEERMLEKPEPAARPISIQEKRSSLEKPERPPKPELVGVLLPTVLPNDDSADEDSFGGNKSRQTPAKPPRPQPPPPPPPSIKVKSAVPTAESTDL